MEITVIGDKSGVVGWIAGAVRTGEIYVANVGDMVAKVLSAIGTNKISRLNILDHRAKTTTTLTKKGVVVGTATSIGIKIGSDVINEYNVLNFKSLWLLKGHFTDNGFVHLQQCDVGQNQELLKKMAANWAVPVYAGTGAHNPLLRINYGDYVRCEPNGVYQADVARP